MTVDNQTTLRTGHILITFPQWDEGSAYSNLLSYMVYPDDEDKRKSWLVRLLMEQRLLAYTAKNDNAYNDRHLSDDVGTLSQALGGPAEFHKALFTRQHNPTANELQARFPSGYFTGLTLMTALHLNASPQKTFDHLADGADEFQISIADDFFTFKRQSFLNNTWPKFRCVAHYWAAYAYFLLTHHEYWETPPSAPFQQFQSDGLRKRGEPDGFEGFLRLADRYLWKAATTIPPGTRKNTPLLPIQGTVVLDHPWLPSVLR